MEESRRQYKGGNVLLQVKKKRVGWSAWMDSRASQPVAHVATSITLVCMHKYTSMCCTCHNKMSMDVHSEQGPILNSLISANYLRQPGNKAKLAIATA